MQDDFCDLFGVRLPLGYDPRPIRGRGGKHHAVVGVDPHRSRAATRKIYRILRPFRTKFSGPENNEILRRSIVVTRNCKTAFVRPVGNRCAVAFVPDESVICSENIVVPQTGAIENPMISVLHPIAKGFALAPPLCPAVAMADASQAVFRINPKPLVTLLSIALSELNPPPASVPTEEGDVTAICHKLFDAAPHRLAPVLVVTQTQKEAIGCKKIAKVLMYIEVGAVIDRKTFTFQPADEPSIPMPESLPQR